MWNRILILILSLATLFSGAAAARTRRGAARPFVATAFVQSGPTKSGLPAQRGIVAADPRVLPIGTEIEVRSAGPYSGIYIVADSGPAIRGRRIDIFVPSRLRARQFGRKRVLVRVIRWGSAQNG